MTVNPDVRLPQQDYREITVSALAIFTGRWLLQYFDRVRGIRYSLAETVDGGYVAIAKSHDTGDIELRVFAGWRSLRASDLPERITQLSARRCATTGAKPQLNQLLEDFSMTLRRKTREEQEQMRTLFDYIYDEEARIRHHCAAEGRYRGDLVHRALVRTMEVALGLGLSIGAGRVRYRAVQLRQADIEEMPRTA